MAREKTALSAFSAENSRRDETHTAAHGRTGLNLNPQDVRVPGAVAVLAMAQVYMYMFSQNWQLS